MSVMTTTSKPTKLTRMPRSAIPFVVIGTVSVVSGGLVSAISASSPSYPAAWAVAYLVLVSGMGQLALGLAQAGLTVRQPRARLVAAEAITFNVANIAILVGALTTSMVLVDLGGGLFLISLAVFLWGARSPRPKRKWMLYGFRVLIAILMVSTPIGLIIASARAS